MPHRITNHYVPSTLAPNLPATLTVWTRSYTRKHHHDIDLVLQSPLSTPYSRTLFTSRVSVAPCPVPDKPSHLHKSSRRAASRVVICITESQARGTTHWTRRGHTKLRVNGPLFCRDSRKESVEHGRDQGADPQVHRVIAVARRNPTRHEADVSSLQVHCDSTTPQQLYSISVKLHIYSVATSVSGSTTNIQYPSTLRHMIRAR